LRHKVAIENDNRGEGNGSWWRWRRRIIIVLNIIDHGLHLHLIAARGVGGDLDQRTGSLKLRARRPVVEVVRGRIRRLVRR